MILTKFDYYDNEKGAYVLYSTEFLHLTTSGLVTIDDNGVRWGCFIDSVKYIKRCNKYKYVFKVI